LFVVVVVVVVVVIVIVVVIFIIIIESLCGVSFSPVLILQIKKKERTIFPPAQTPRKEDLLMESGQYFLAENERKKLKAYAMFSSFFFFSSCSLVSEEKNKQSLEKMKAKALEKEKKYIAPDEPQWGTKRSGSQNALVAERNTNTVSDTVNALKANAKVDDRGF
jgi:hypothetical protein